MLEPLPYEAPEDMPAEEIEVIDAENVSSTPLENNTEKSTKKESDDDKKSNDDLDFEIPSFDDGGSLSSTVIFDTQKDKIIILRVKFS